MANIEIPNAIDQLKQAAQNYEKSRAFTDLQLYIGLFDTHVMGSPEIIDPAKPDTDFILEQFAVLSGILAAKKERFLPLIARKILKYLAQPEITSNLMKRRDGARALGWFLLSQGSKLGRHPDPIHIDRLVTVISQVSGIELNKYSNKILEEQVIALYGRACWEFYGASKDNNTNDSIDITTAAEIYCEGIPLLAERIFKADCNQLAQQLPSTLTL